MYTSTFQNSHLQIFNSEISELTIHIQKKKNQPAFLYCSITLSFKAKRYIAVKFPWQWQKQYF